MGCCYSKPESCDIVVGAPVATIVAPTDVIVGAPVATVVAPTDDTLEVQQLALDVQDIAAQPGVAGVTTTATHLIFPMRDQPGTAMSAIVMKPEGQKDVDDVNVTEWGLWTQTFKAVTLTVERKNVPPAKLLCEPIVKPIVDFGRSDLKVSTPLNTLFLCLLPSSSMTSHLTRPAGGDRRHLRARHLADIRADRALRLQVDLRGRIPARSHHPRQVQAGAVATAHLRGRRQGRRAARDAAAVDSAGPPHHGELRRLEQLHAAGDEEGQDHADGALALRATTRAPALPAPHLRS